MKGIQIIAIVVLLLPAANAFAKGGCGGGHGSCGHGHGGSGVHAGCSSADNDVFKELNNKICPGYIVYNEDTLQGVITCADNTISIRTSPLQDSTYLYRMDHVYDIKDTNLHVVMLVENGTTLFMERLKDKKLYRLLHAGKLSIYDAYFSFDYYSKQFYNEYSWVMYDNHYEKLACFQTTSVKRKLVADINKVYGLDLSQVITGKKNCCLMWRC